MLKQFIMLLKILFLKLTFKGMNMPPGWERNIGFFKNYDAPYLTALQDPYKQHTKDYGNEFKKF